MSDLRHDLLRAMEAKGYTFKRLLEESGLGCDTSSLNRKLNGGQELSAEDGRALAVVLGIRVTAVDRLIQLSKDLGVEVRWTPRERAA
jgi:transcriptional regulator with XRE-family HTH domain